MGKWIRYAAKFKV